MSGSGRTGAARREAAVSPPTIPVFSGESADAVWLAAAGQFRDGKAREQPSRAGTTMEFLHSVLVIANPRQRWIPSRLPAMNPAFAIAEALWILSGRSDAALPVFFNPKLPEYVGHEHEFGGAYGARLRRTFGIDQLSRAADALSRNPASRQVVLQIWDAARDLPDAEGAPASLDVPCNLISMLKVRGGRLEWTQVLRSNDLLLGVPHNVVQFTFLQEVVAGWLGLEPGQYTHLSDSLHVYAADLGAVGAAVSVKAAPSTDSLALPRDESQLVLADMNARISELIAKDLDRSRFEKATDPHGLPAGYRNLLLILGADSARRRGWEDGLDTCLRACDNPALLQMWQRWMARVGIRSARPTI